MPLDPLFSIMPSARDEGRGDRVVDDRIRLVASTEPAVVFASLAAQSIRHLCDVCTVEIVDGHARYRLVQPPRPRVVGGLARLQSRAAHRATNLAQVDFAHTHAKGADTFSGAVSFVWHRRSVTRAERTLAALLVDHAVQTVLWQRSESRRNELIDEFRRPPGTSS